MLKSAFMTEQKLYQDYLVGMTTRTQSSDGTDYHAMSEILPETDFASLSPDLQEHLAQTAHTTFGDNNHNSGCPKKTRHGI